MLSKNINQIFLLLDFIKIDVEEIKLSGQVSIILQESIHTWLRKQSVHSNWTYRALSIQSKSSTLYRPNPLTSLSQDSLAAQDNPENPDQYKTIPFKDTSCLSAGHDENT